MTDTLYVVGCQVVVLKSVRGGGSRDLYPLVVHSTPEFEDLKELAPGCITRYHAYHYLGFADTQWKLYSKQTPPRVKPLLYVYRVLWTGIHLMRTGELRCRPNSNRPHCPSWQRVKHS